MKCQRPKRSLNVELGTAGNADMKMWQTKINEILDKRKDLSTRRRDTRRVRALVESVQDDVSWVVESREHVLEALCHHTKHGRLFAIIVLQIKPGEDIATRIRLSGKLDEKRGEQVPDILLVEIPEIKIKVSH